MRARSLIALFLFVLVGIAPTVSAKVEIDSNTFGGLRARPIGPATMSGRIAAIDAVADDPLTIYAGAASGGVWRSKDAGVTWSPVFDEHPQSIGAIRIDPSNAETIWVGTGESWTRNSTSIGKGVFKSTDGGDSWEDVGLHDTERIARIRVSPEDGDTVYVCATGHLWGANEERGVFRTTDGGESWEKILYVDEDTGCSDLEMDPQDPDILYAGMWQFRRYPDFFYSGGPGSGLYKTVDGGETWTELTEGLPGGEKGRIAVAVAPSRASRVYAVVEAEETALYRSDDQGHTWEEQSQASVVEGRPFYFAYLVVDPADHDRVYKPGFLLGVSTDAGKTFTTASGSMHPDLHALWLNPKNPNELVLGTDGGVYISYDRGGHFRMVGALPVSQFYEVSADNEWPYNVYGGLQDNGSWTGPSRAVGGIRNSHWKNLGFGDGFHVYRDPSDTNIVFVEYQGGKLLRHHLATGEIKQIMPLEAEGDPEYRFNWNAPIHISPNRPATVYYGGQFLFRSRDHGESWEKISPDLTTDDPERQRQDDTGGLTVDNSTAENNTTIYSISESPTAADVIWVGTDDGNVQVTRDGGASWTNVVANIPGVPEGTWVSHVEASPHDAGTAHVTFDGHRSGDMTTYVFRTTDHGATWTALATDEIEGFAHVVVQDPVNPELLFLGTEMGLFITLDGGKQWARFEGNFPRVPVRDLDIHPREGDLIAGTHGRGIYILDDLTPLRTLTAEALESKFVLLPSRDSVMVLAGGIQSFAADDEYVGPNPPGAASILFYQKKRHIFGDLKIEIYDADGEKITTIPAGKRRGINRAGWPMRLPAPKMPPATSLAPAFVGPRVPEGTYTYKVIKGKETFEGKVTLVPDPRSSYTADERALQQKSAMDLYDLLERLSYALDATADLRDQAEERGDELGKSGLSTKLQEFADELEEFRGSLVATREGGGITGEEKLREKMAAVYGAVSGYDGPPTRSQLDRTEVFRGEVEMAEQTFETFGSGDELASLNGKLEGKKMEPLHPMSREEWQEKKDKEQGNASLLPGLHGFRIMNDLLPVAVSW